MIDEPDDEDERSKKKKKGDGDSEGDSDSWGRGKAGAASGAKVGRPSAANLKKILANWQHFEDVTQVVQAVAEFFTDVPMRASANLSVLWEKTRGFAIVTKFMRFGKSAADDLKVSRSRAAGRDTRGFQRKPAPTKKPGMNLGPRPPGSGV
jgi:hypothetical protein